MSLRGQFTLASNGLTNVKLLLALPFWYSATIKRHERDIGTRVWLLKGTDLGLSSDPFHSNTGLFRSIVSSESVFRAIFLNGQTTFSIFLLTEINSHARTHFFEVPCWRLRI